MLTPSHSGPIKSECLGLVHFQDSLKHLNVQPILGEQLLLSTYQNKPPGADFISWCPFSSFQLKTGKATLKDICRSDCTSEAWVISGQALEDASNSWPWFPGRQKATEILDAKQWDFLLGYIYTAILQRVGRNSRFLCQTK
jgi:hypothetical protein